MFWKRKKIENVEKDVEEEFNENDFKYISQKCDNCGAPLKINKKDMTCKCDYCKTEYYVRKGSNEIEANCDVDQIVKIKIKGQEKRFYIGNITTHKIYGEAGRNIDGKLITNIITTKDEITLIEI